MREEVSFLFWWCPLVLLLFFFALVILILPLSTSTALAGQALEFERVFTVYVEVDQGIPIRNLPGHSGSGRGLGRGRRSALRDNGFTAAARCLYRRLPATGEKRAAKDERRSVTEAGRRMGRLLSPQPEGGYVPPRVHRSVGALHTYLAASRADGLSHDVSDVPVALVVVLVCAAKVLPVRVGVEEKIHLWRPDDGVGGDGDDSKPTAAPPFVVHISRIAHSEGSSYLPSARPVFGHIAYPPV